MKKAMFTALFVLLKAFAFTQVVGETVYKELNVNGETFLKWLKVDYIIEYDSNGNSIHSKSSDGYER